MEGFGKKQDNSQETPLGKNKFVSGLHHAEDLNVARPPIADIIDSAIQKKAVKDSFRQRYDSKQTPDTKRVTNRMLGEKED